MAAPRNPVRSLVWALGWLLAAALGATMLVVFGADLFDHTLDAGVRNRRAGFLLLILPAISIVALVLCLVRAARGFGPWHEYVDRTSPEQRRAASDARLAGTPVGYAVAFAIIAGIASLSGIVLLIVFWSTLGGILAALALIGMLIVVFGMLCIGLVDFVVRCTIATRRSLAVTSSSDTLDR